MRIGVILYGVNPESGGAYTFEKSLLNALLKYQGEHCFYILNNNAYDSSDTEFIKYINLSNYKLDKRTFNPMQKWKDKIRKYLGFYHLINKIKIREELDVAIKKLNIELLWFLTPFCEEVNIPFIFTVWDLQHRLQPYFPEVSFAGWTWEDREKYYGLYLPRAAYVLATNEAGRREIEKFYSIPKERIKLLPHPTPTFVADCSEHSFDVKSKYNIPDNYLFYPAQFWPHKNHICLLLAQKILADEFNLNFSVVFSGSDKGNKDFIQEKIIDLGLTDKVFFLDFIPINDLVEVYRNAFAMVYPSFFGTENMPPIEAFALGCPVIASNVAGAKEQMGNAALLFEPTKEYELALLIKKLHGDSALRIELVNNGIKRASQWTAQDYINGVIEIINEFKLIRRCWSSTEEYIHL